VAIFDYTDGVPGAILWPENGEPKLVIPDEGTIAGWYEFPVVWPPLGKWQFLVGQEQYYDWPNCDSFCFDDNEFITTEKHTWFGSEGRWSNFEATNNLMMRIMAGYIGAVSPTSLGRIKGLYR
jgi:hypothetical protein